MPTKKSSSQATTAAQATNKSISDLARSVNLSPRMSEKTAQLSGSAVYVFTVAVGANRVAIRQAFKEMYGIMPLAVRIIRVHGKEKRFGRIVSRQSDWKKAYIALPQGTTLDLFATV